jgi:hypothetical protein
MRQLTRQRFTRAQNAFLNPVTVESARAEVINILGGGLTKDSYGADLITVNVRMSERPGQPIRLTAKDTLAAELKVLADNKTPFSFTANLSGNPIPYLFATSLKTL